MASLPAQPEAVFRQYDQQRRAQLTTIFSRISVFTFLAAFLLNIVTWLTAPTPPSPVLVVTGSLLLVYSLLCGVSLLVLRRGRVLTGAGIFVLVVFLSIAGYHSAWILDHGLDAQAYILFCAYVIGICLSGILGNRVLILLNTILVSLLTIVYTMVLPQVVPIPHATDTFTASHATTIAALISIQWGFAIVMMVATGTYLGTLRQLGESDLQVERARQLDALKDEFIASVNHELRTPIMALFGCLETLRKDIEHGRPAQQLLHWTDRAMLVSQSLRTLVLSILETRRIERSAPLVLTAVPVRPALDAAILLMDPQEAQSADRPLHIAMPPDLFVWGDTTRVQQILTNLLTNAVKYSPDPQSPIEVHARYVKRAGAAKRRQAPPPEQFVEIQVRDFGLGIPPDQIPLLFGQFVRLARDLASTVPGNGLGLYLCKQFAESMGGRIWVESTGVPGEGSTFFVQLPLPPVQQGV